MVFKMKNFLKDESIDRKEGKYSVNKTAGAFIIFVLLFTLFCVKPLERKIILIKNSYVKNICAHLIKPVHDISVYFKIYNFFPRARNAVLDFTKLNERLEWENFYYGYDENEFDKSLNADIFLKDFFQNIDFENELSLKTEKGHGRKGYLSASGESIKKGRKEKDIEKDEPVTEENGNTETPPEKQQDKKSKPAEHKTERKKQTPPPQKKLRPAVKKAEYTAKRPFRILMFGDSQMRSLAGGLQKLTSGQKAIQITEISVHSSGFVRGDYYNWNKKLESIFAGSKEKPYDAVAFILGMNDYQNFYSNGKILAKESSEWEEKYKEKIEKLLNIVLSNSKKVYWFGMPVVRKPVYNEDLEYIDKVQKAVSDVHPDGNLVRFSLRNIAPGRGAPYTDTVKTQNGKHIKLMRDDGIHFTISGGEYLMQSFLKTLYNDWSIER